MEPRISVVIPTRDTREMTLSALRSLRRQSRPPSETVLVDDGSSDGTVKAVSENHPEVKSVRIPHGVGFAGAVNAGVSSSHGDLIWLLNSDTVVGPRAVERLISSFDRDPRLGISGAMLSYPDGRAQWSGGRFPGILWLFGQASGLPGLLGRMPIWRKMKPVSGTATLDVDWVTGAAMALRREVWSGVGPLHDDYLSYCQDLDLCWRAKLQGWKVNILPDVRVIHHHGGTIRSAHDTVEGVLATHLWRDLVRFFVIHHGVRVGLRAARSIQVGGRFRVMIRKIVTPFVDRSDREQWRADTDTYERALRDIPRMVSTPPGPLPH
jgi:GT2 family glycosyltransferase